MRVKPVVHKAEHPQTGLAALDGLVAPEFYCSLYMHDPVRLTRLHTLLNRRRFV